MNNIVKVLITISFLFSLGSNATPEDLKRLILKEVPHFCDRGKWNKTIRSNKGAYCETQEGAVLARITCPATDDFAESDCVTGPKSLYKNNTLEDVKTYLNTQENYIKVCNFLADKFSSIFNKLNSAACNFAVTK